MPIAHAEEVEQVFDAISYCKGACVVKMLNAVLGMDMFKKGLQVTKRFTKPLPRTERSRQGPVEGAPAPVVVAEESPLHLLLCQPVLV